MFQNILSKVGLGALPKNFGYTVGDRVDIEYQTIWQLHTGQKRSDGSPVSVFVCPKKDLPPASLMAAKNAEKLAKSMRHPDVLRALDSCEVDGGLYLVTEAVTPLLAATQAANEGSDVAVWGLYQALNALSFLHESGFTHGLVGPSSVFVTSRGDYRLAGFELCSKTASVDDLVAGFRLLGPRLHGWPEPPSALCERGVPTQSIDFWGVTVLMAYVYGVARSSRRGPDFKPDLGRTPQELPPDLRRSFADLQKFGPLRGRAPISELIGQKYFSEHPAVQVMHFLGSLHIKSPEDKETFFEQLPSLLDGLPRAMQVNQLLPELLQAQKFPGQEAAQVLPSILKIGVTLKEDEFKEKVAPLVVQLFASPDRAIRFRLLVSLGDMIDNLDDAMINDKIFPEVVNGFSDSNAPVREATVKSLIHFTPKLRAKTVEQRVTKLLPKLLQDPEPSIRTNSVICCGRIAQYLPKPAACQLLSQAFQAGFKDPFSPCRSASMNTLLATASFFSAEDVACRLLPLVCARLVDPDPNVSNSAFDAAPKLQAQVKQMMEEQRIAQENAGGVEDLPSTDNASAGQQGRFGSWMSTVGSAMGQKIIGSMAGPSSETPGPTTPVSGSATTSSVATAPTPVAREPVAAPPARKAAEPAPPAGNANDVDSKAWDNDNFWEEFGDLPTAPPVNAPKEEVPDSFWEEFGDMPTAPPVNAPKAEVPEVVSAAPPAASGGGIVKNAAPKGLSLAKAKAQPAVVSKPVEAKSTLMDVDEDFWKEFDM